MKAGKKLTLVLVLNVFIGSASVNGQILYDALSSQTYYTLPADKTGNPFWMTSWGAGTIRAANGISYKAAKMNYDVLANKVIFESDGTKYVFQESVIEFNIESEPNGTWKRFVLASSQHPSLPSPFVEVLESGRIIFLKHVGKSVVEVSEYNSGPKKVIEDRIQYFLLSKGALKNVSLNKKNLLEVFSEYKDEIESFLNKQSVSPKNETGWVQVIHYLNTK